MVNNRLSAATRWPLDPLKRLERAQTDIDYCMAMISLGFPIAKLCHLYWRAEGIKHEAQAELVAKQGRPRNH